MSAVGALRIAAPAVVCAGALLLLVAHPSGWTATAAALGAVGLAAALVGARLRRGADLRCVHCGGRCRLIETHTSNAGGAAHLVAAYRCRSCRSVRRIPVS